MVELVARGEVWLELCGYSFGWRPGCNFWVSVDEVEFRFSVAARCGLWM